MTRKTTSAYEAVLRSVCRHVPGIKAPISLMTDFEIAIRTAFKRVWPQVAVAGCWFHYAQVNIFVRRWIIHAYTVKNLTKHDFVMRTILETILKMIHRKSFYFICITKKFRCIQSKCFGRSFLFVILFLKYKRNALYYKTVSASL